MESGEDLAYGSREGGWAAWCPLIARDTGASVPWGPSSNVSQLPRSHTRDVPLLPGVERVGVSYSKVSPMCLYNFQSLLMIESHSLPER